jgi:UDP-glucose 4-epimerase
LVREGEEVTVLDNLSTGRKENLQHVLAENGMRFVDGDIRDKETVRSCVEDADRVVHLAAIASVPYSLRKPGETHDVNVEGTLNVLQACHEHGIGKLVYASSCAVYGEPRFIPVTEDHQFSATSPYAESKIASEAYCQIFREKHHLQTICLRAFNVYGANQYNSDYGGVITQFIERLKKQQAPIIYGDGEQSRDFIHVDDVVETITRIIRTPNDSDGTYNLGSGRATTINQLVRILQRIVGDGEFSPVYAPPRPGDIRHSQADIGKARTHLGFEPLTSLEKGLERLVSAETNLAVAAPVQQRAGGLPRVGNAGKY